LIGLVVKRILAAPNSTDRVKGAERDNKNSQIRTITLTANRKSACEILLHHARDKSETSCPVHFISIERALDMQHDLLIVEEAGSISIPVLTRLTEQANDIIFATTVQGYEGAGRGFALRFSKRLDRIRPDWMMLKPEQPIRWSGDDPLEAFINDAFLLKTQLPAVPQSNTLTPQHCVVERIDKNDLSTNEELLQEVYALLIQAHYQTTPSDLRNMMDQEKLLVFTQRTNKVLTGAALVALEGEIPQRLHANVVDKKRRLADQILPQLLSQCSADSSVLPLRFARIVRIAIHPYLHRRGFGTEFFSQLREQLASITQSVGASFGADEQSLSFWLKLGLTPIHYGFKANPRSALRSACLIISDDITTTRQIENARQILHTNLVVIDQYSGVTDPVRRQLITATDQPGTELSDAIKTQLITSFCESKRSFSDTVGFIYPKHKVEPSNDLQQHIHALLQQRNPLTPKDRREAEQTVRDLTKMAVARK